jgi:alpha-amylase/alpha-mannosidase (GH57 family)
MSETKLNLAFLWHQHQPYYKNSEGYFQMPWVRFHGVKDYLDMILLLKEFPNVKQNINLVPSLLFQINDYVEKGVKDNVWILTEKLAPDLNLIEKRTILNHFFMANYENMIKPYKRYRELFLKIYEELTNLPLDEQLRLLSEQEFRDLQVWYNLTWVGMISRERPAIQKLFDKAAHFSEEDKKTLLNEHLKIMSEIIPTHRELWQSGQIELTTSPFYHPILPLLIDTSIGKASDPNINLPSHFSHAEDAEVQVERGLAYFEKLFAGKPSGMWPSEGSVSEEAAELLMKQNIKWIGTDEGVLEKSLGKAFDQTSIYRPFRFRKGSRQINIFFRDHYLSDAIGFVYSNWDEDKAVDDFIARLISIRKKIVEKSGEAALQNHIVSVILDGENCWEYYRNDGRTFLRKLYARLSKDPQVQTVAYSEFLDRASNIPKLPKLHPGSWINSNFNIWIGSDEDNRAWDLLKNARDFLVEKENEESYLPETISEAWEKILIAEGSDWCWWYGDEHSSSQDLEFDLLFRQHLIRVYEIFGEEAPIELYQSIKHKHYQRFASKSPTHLITPQIDGRSSHFFEWSGAAVYDGSVLPQSAMHQVSRNIDKFYVGFDTKKLYLRIDFLSKPDPLYEYVVSIKTPKQMTVVLSPLKGIIEKVVHQNGSYSKTVLDPTLKLDLILEAAIAFKDLDLKPRESLGFQLQIKQRNQIIEAFPTMNIIEIEVPDENYDLREWSV